ncbi:hypothetical protein C2U47_06975 [Aeromonas sp. ASNIH7]|nr:hypothetical protein C2U47_06975 [Aeromonas sp. ASNIH7]
MFCLATNQIAQTGLSSLPPVIYYSEQLFSHGTCNKIIDLLRSGYFINQYENRFIVFIYRILYGKGDIFHIFFEQPLCYESRCWHVVLQ